MHSFTIVHNTDSFGEQSLIVKECIIGFSSNHVTNIASKSRPTIPGQSMYERCPPAQAKPSSTASFRFTALAFVPNNAKEPNVNTS